jgi:murein DD-endopeptidase MepM/ murein hydrolase activator NlpD
MQIKNILKTLTLTSLMALSAAPVMGQDLLARQAPVDRKMKAVDTVALRSIIERELGGSLSAQLYSEWSNKYAHRATQLPDSFRIDLRGFAMPTSSRVITSQFGHRWGRMHKGLDIKVYIGDTIRAAFDGKIRVVNYEGDGYGNYVVIRHNNGLETIYGHMSKHLVREDQMVHAGDPIGLGGNTGRSTGSHLHFETRLCGVALNPALLFDFRNQDVTGDFYLFRSSRYERESVAANKTTGRKQDSYTDEEINSDADPSDRKQLAQAKSNSRKSASKKNNRDSQFHKVRKGETLYSIAKKRGMTVSQLCKMNHIGKNMRIRPGQILKYT